MAREQIAGYYRELLGREPDQGGLDAWTNAVNEGHLTLAGVSGMIARSDEARGQRQQRATNLANLTGERDNYLAAAQGLQQRIGDFESRIADYQSRIGGYEQRIGGLEGQIGNYRTQVSGLQNQYNTALGERDQWQKKSGEFENLASDWEDKFGIKSEEYDRAKGEADMYRNQAVGAQLRALRSGATSGGGNTSSSGDASLQGGRGSAQRYDDNAVAIEKNIQAESGALSRKGPVVQRIQTSNRRQSAPNAAAGLARGAGSGSYYASRFG